MTSMMLHCFNSVCRQIFFLHIEMSMKLYILVGMA